MRRRLMREMAVAASLFVAIAGCTSTASPPPAEPLAHESPDFATASAIQFRKTFGLRADTGYVQAVAADPRADVIRFGVPLLPAEIAELDRRARNSDAVVLIVQGFTK